MRIDNIVNLGFNCSSTMVARRLALFAGCSPFDWCIVNTRTILDVFCCMFVHSIDECVEKFMRDIENSGGGFGVNAPHHTANDREKIRRRFQRLLDLVKNRDKNILFTFISTHVPREDMGNDQVYFDLLKLSKIISLFRPTETFKIVFVHCQDLSVPLEGNVENIQLPITENPNNWVWPCHHHLKLKYGLEENQTGGVWI